MIRARLARSGEHVGHQLIVYTRVAYVKAKRVGRQLTLADLMIVICVAAVIISIIGIISIDGSVC